MNRNRIRLTESQLHRVIKESVKKMLNEISNDKLKAAANKAIDLSDNTDEFNGYERGANPLTYVDGLREYLERYVQNYSKFGGKTPNYEYKGGNFPNNQAMKLISHLNEIEKFIRRKVHQADNLTDNATW